MTLGEEGDGVGKVEEEVKGAEEKAEDEVAGHGVLGRRRGHREVSLGPGGEGHRPKGHLR